MAYCMYKDCMGLTISVGVYLLMFSGNLLFTYTVGYPFFSGQEEASYDVYIELPLYWLLWSLMIWSHLATMCRDPGFIQLGYKYQFEKFQDSQKPLMEEIFLIQASGNRKFTKSITLVKTQPSPDAIDIEMAQVHPTRNKSMQPLKEMKSKDLNAVIDKICRICDQCGGVKPPRAHHCSVCKRCVLKMDHHCPWMNNCIGLYNEKAFLLFNLYTMLTSFYTIVRATVEGVRCGTSKTTCPTYFHIGITAGAIVIGILCLIFMIFTAVMLGEIINMMKEETSTIDRKKKKQSGTLEPSLVKEKPGLIQALGGWSWLWFIPHSIGVDQSVENQLHQFY